MLAIALLPRSGCLSPIALLPRSGCLSPIALLARSGCLSPIALLARSGCLSPTAIYGWLRALLPMCVLVFVTHRNLLLVIGDNVRDLIEFLRRPFSEMIPGARLPVVDRLCLWNPGRKVQQQVIRQRVDKRLVQPSHLIETLLSILFMPQSQPHLGEGVAHAYKIL